MKDYRCEPKILKVIIFPIPLYLMIYSVLLSLHLKTAFVV